MQIVVGIHRESQDDRQEDGRAGEGADRAKLDHAEPAHRRAARSDEKIRPDRNGEERGGDREKRLAGHCAARPAPQRRAFSSMFEIVYDVTLTITFY